MRDFTTLQVVWFILISVLWVGYFVLEGFDFGVGMLFKLIGRNNEEKRAILHTIGPVWDGNEVWLLVAGGATFAAFPEWYATLFSGFYLALFVILVALIIRNVGFEFWGKRDSSAWRTGWEWCIAIGSFLPALLWGVGWANIVGGVPIDADAEFTGNFFTLLNPYALLGGLATLSIFITHGALFLTIRTTGEIQDRARHVARISAPVTVIIPAAFLGWTVANQSPLDTWSTVLAGAAAFVLLAAAVLTGRSPARAFFATCTAIALFFTALFVDLFPMTMISSTDLAYSMTLNFSSSSNYTLIVITVVAVLLVPVVLMYQAWTYWVFRHRLSAEDFGDVRTPLDLIDAKREEKGDGDEPLAGAGPGSRPTGP
ncbi:MAG: cytochrome d ubiquinol oxidase subunit II [Solirubrobacterales bacterium]